MRPIFFQVNKDNYLSNIRKIFEKINSYEQDKLERKNIYNDYLMLISKYNEFAKRKIYFNIKIQPKLIFDTVFFFGKVEFHTHENIFETNFNFHSFELKNTKTDTDEINSLYNRSNTIEQRGKNRKYRTTKISTVKLKEEEKLYDDDKKKIIKAINDNENYFRNRIQVNKITKSSLCTILLFCIIILLVT